MNLFVKNYLSLSVLQLIGFLCNFFQLPILANNLGLESFGILSFILLICNYLVWITNWGFYIGGTKRVSVQRNNKKHIIKILLDSFMAQLILILITSILYIIIIKSLYFDHPYSAYLISAVMIIVTSSLSPLWFLNGLELLWISSGLNMISKLITLLGVLVLIKKPSDINLYIYIVSSANLLIFFSLSIYYFFKWRSFSFMPKIKDALSILLTDFQYFSNTITTSTLTSAIPFSLGFMCGPSELAIFSLAEKVKSFVVGLSQPIMQTIFPRMCYVYNNKDCHNYNFFLVIIIFFILGIIVASIVNLYSYEIIEFISGNDFDESTHILQILAFSPAFVFVSTFCLYQILIPLNEEKRWFTLANLLMLLIILISLPIISKYASLGAALITVFSEIVFSVVLLYGVVKNKSKI